MEIKFRAYDSTYKHWYKASLKKDGWTTHDTAITQSDGIVGDWMQFTGLKDKTGVEIWEGDIVECTDMHDSNVFDNVWKRNEAGICIPIPQVVKKYEDGIRWDFPSDIYTHPTWWRVVGNVQENPDLLPTNTLIS